MRMTLEPGRTYDVVSPDELSHQLHGHHSRMMDDLVRAQVEGIKVINTRWLSSGTGNPFQYEPPAGYVFTLLTLILASVDPTQAATYCSVVIADDPVGGLPTMDRLTTANIPTNGTIVFQYSKGNILVMNGQTLQLASPYATGGRMIGLLLPTEMIGKLYV